MPPTETLIMMLIVIVALGFGLSKNPTVRKQIKKLLQPPQEHSVTYIEPNKKISATILEDRQPTSNRTCLAHSWSRYREEYMGKIYWLDGHPTDEQLLEKGGMNNRTLQHWLFLSAGDFMTPGQMAIDMRLNQETFDNHIEHIKQDLSERGWQVVGEERTIRQVIPDLYHNWLTVIQLTKTA